MSQRTGGFTGGIQAGTTASSVESIGLEEHLSAAVASVFFDHPDFEWIPELSGDEVARLLKSSAVLPGVRPDGGIALSRRTGKIVWAAEAKKQGERGNAIERWYKNWEFLRAFGVRRYVTFCTGDGFFEGRSAERCLAAAQVLDRSTPRFFGRLRTPPRVAWNQPADRLWIYRYPSVPDREELCRVIRLSLEGLR